MDPLSINAAVHKVRSRLQAASKASLLQRQAASIKNAPAMTSPLASRISLTAPKEDDVRQALIRVIQRLGSGPETIEWPATADVEAEWTAYEKNKQPNPGQALPEKDKNARTVESVSLQTTILYLHGGAY